MNWKLVLCLFFWALEAQASDSIFPDVGSYRITKTVYFATDQEGMPQRMEVSAVIAGRPIFRGRFGGSSGILFETESAVVIAEDGCGIEPEAFHPPAAPNVCGWTPCQVPLGGEIRKAVQLYVRMHRCQAQEGVMTASAIRSGTESIPGLGTVAVTVTAMRASFGSWFASFSWTASILEGFGEVHGESAGRETRVIGAHFLPRQSVLSSERPAEDTLVIVRSAIAVRPTFGDIIAFGDSLSAGFGAAPEDAYPAQLEQLLRTAGLDLRVGNAGVIGELSLSARARLGDIIAARPKLVIIAFGANDALQGVSREAIQSNITSMVHDLKAAGIKVLLVGLETDEMKTSYARHLRGVYEYIAREEVVSLVPFMLTGVLGNPDRLSADGMHPNGSGYRVIAQNILPYVDALVREQ